MACAKPFFILFAVSMVVRSRLFFFFLSLHHVPLKPSAFSDAKPIIVYRVLFFFQQKKSCVRKHKRAPVLTNPCLPPVPLSLPNAVQCHSSKVKPSHTNDNIQTIIITFLNHHLRPQPCYPPRPPASSLGSRGCVSSADCASAPRPCSRAASSRPLPPRSGPSGPRSRPPRARG